MPIAPRQLVCRLKQVGKPAGRPPRLIRLPDQAGRGAVVLLGKVRLTMQRADGPPNGIARGALKANRPPGTRSPSRASPSPEQTRAHHEVTARSSADRRFSSGFRGTACMAPVLGSECGFLRVGAPALLLPGPRPGSPRPAPSIVNAPGLPAGRAGRRCGGFCALFPGAWAAPEMPARGRRVRSARRARRPVARTAPARSPRARASPCPRPRRATGRAGPWSTRPRGRPGSP